MRILKIMFLCLALGCVVRFLSSLTFRQEQSTKLKNENSPVRTQENRQVSEALGQFPHYDVEYTINPRNADNIVAGCVVLSGLVAHPSVVVYSSFDGGKSWKVNTSVSNGLKIDAASPALTFDESGNAYFGYLRKGSSSAVTNSQYFVLFRSEDGGNTWTEMTGKKGTYQFDSFRLFCDRSADKRSGRLYLLGTELDKRNGERAQKKLTLYYSEDKGVTVKGPLSQIDDVGSFTGHMLPDGTLIVLYTKPQNGTITQNKSVQLCAVTSKDGGTSFSAPALVANVLETKKSAVSFVPSLAVDMSSSPLGGRLYAAWLDCTRGYYDVYFSFSADKGKTWSTPIIINDNLLALAANGGADQTCPAVAVNKDGVVGVLWYDRRDDGLNAESFEGFSFKETIIEHDYRWQAYFSASLDGGESFLPNTKVSSALHSNNAPNNWVPIAQGDKASFCLPQNLYPAGGKAGCFASSSDGRFHALWADSRSGVSQIWTSPIEVGSKTFVNGSEEDSILDDISSWTSLMISNTKFVHVERKFEFDAQIFNKSAELAFSGPIKLRLLGTNSDLGNWEAVQADNRIRTSGALWDFTNSLIDGKLGPGAASRSKHLILRLKEEVPLEPITFRQFLGLRIKILGKREP